MRRYSKLIFSLFLMVATPLAHAENKVVKAPAKTAPAVTSAPTPDPEKIYRDEGLYAPSECVSLKKPWTAGFAAPVYDQPVYFKGQTPPASLKKVGTLTTGQKLRVLKTLSFVKPFPMIAQVTHQDDIGMKFKKGETIYALASVGEGSKRFWQAGQIKEGDFDFFYDGPQEKFSTPKAKTMDEYGKKYEEYEPQWWYQVKSEKGNVGWVVQLDVNDKTSLYYNEEGCE